MLRAWAFVLIIVLLLLLGGPLLVKKFLRGFFVGMDVYVFVNVEGKPQAYKNPEGYFGHEDKPLDLIPHDILQSDQFETYYNVCWFNCGALFRCGHSFHKTEDNARYCDQYGVAGMLIGKVLEER